MNTKGKYIILSMAIIFVGIGLIGITFAWYSYSNAESNVSGKTISERPSVVFAETEYIESSVIMPILDDDRYNYGAKNSFVITIPSKLRGYDVSVSISLVGIEMDNELKINEYKYELLENNVAVANGNFSDSISNSMEIMPMKLLNVDNLPYSYNYELIIWLSDNKEVQNNLMNKHFRAKVNVVSALKKR